MALWSRFFGSSVSTAAGFGMGAAIGPTLQPITQDVANEAWSRHRVRPISAQAAAFLVAHGLITLAEGQAEAALTGYSDGRFADLVEQAREAPTTGQLFEMRNRGAIDDGDVTDGLIQNGIRSRWRAPLATLRRVLPTVTDQVRFAVREVYNPQQRAFLNLDAEFPDAFATEAAKLGLSRDDAGDYWAAHWELPSYTQLTTMLHRGELSQAAYENALKAADYAPTWREKLRIIAQAIPPLQDMIRFAVREVYDPAKRAALGLDEEYPAAFTAKAALHGMSAQDARDYWAAHWRLPSPEQGYKMLHRDEITLAELDGLLKALDYPKLWRDRLRNIAYLVPGRVDLRRMLAEGVIDRGEVKAGYRHLGYTEVWAERLTVFAEKLAAKSRAGSTGGGAAFVSKAQTQLWSTLHSAYLAGDASDAFVTTKLGQAGVPTGERADVLALWKHEREVQRKRLTAAQVKKAWAKPVTNPATGQPWTRDDALAELLSRGWSSADANTFLDQ